MTTQNLRAVAATVTVLSLLGGCGDGQREPDDAVPAPATSAPSETESSTSPPEETEAAASAVTITMEDFGYSDPGTIAPGTEVMVENLDDAAHTITDEDGAFDLTVAPGETSSFTAPDEPGEYPYVCTFHAGMTGTLVVG